MSFFGFEVFVLKKSWKALATKHLLLSEYSETEMYVTNVQLSENKHVSLKSIFINITNIVYDKNMSGWFNLGTSINSPDHTDFQNK